MLLAMKLFAFHTQVSATARLVCAPLFVFYTTMICTHRTHKWVLDCW